MGAAVAQSTLCHSTKLHARWWMPEYSNKARRGRWNSGDGKGGGGGAGCPATAEGTGSGDGTDRRRVFAQLAANGLRPSQVSRGGANIVFVFYFSFSFCMHNRHNTYTYVMYVLHL